MDTTCLIFKKSKAINPYLSDDIISNILCRLPIKNTIRYRLVCKRWRDLTLTRDFVDLHFQHNSLPVILVKSPKLHQIVERPNRWLEESLFDKWWEPDARIKFVNLITRTFHYVPENLHPRYIYKALFSHAGLIVFEKSFSQDVIILNPINLEKVTISLSREFGIYIEIYGVFFHHSLGEYCSLWRIETSHTTPGQPIGILYKMLNLGSNPFMKTICNPFAHRVKKMYGQPILIDKYLYWILKSEENQDYSGRNDIMQFDIISESFGVKPCPVPVDTKCNFTETHLLNIDGTLSFLVIFPREITIWRLQDHAGQLWTATNYTFSSANFSEFPNPIAVVNGYLALVCNDGLHVCNLMQGTVKCFRKHEYLSGVLFLSHQVSLASLRNCHSTIYLDKLGETVGSHVA